MRDYLLLFVVIAMVCLGLSLVMSFLIRQPVLPILVASGSGGLVLFGLFTALLVWSGRDR